MNVLPVISAWMREYVVSGEYAPVHLTRVRRADLEVWVRRKFGSGMCDTPERVTLAVDAMIAAGIGVTEEQTQTVYCRVTGG